MFGDDGFVPFVLPGNALTETVVMADCDSNCYDCNVNCEECDSN